MKDCCKVGPKTKECVRKSDKKTFKFPRRFSKKHCLTKKIKGFTMRASCAPFKGCKKGGNAKKIKGGKFDKHRNIEKDSYEDALDKPELEIPITDDAFYELSDSSYDLNQNIPDVSLNLDDSNLDSTRFSDIANDTSITDLSFDQDEIFENPPSPIRRQRGGLPTEEVRRGIHTAINQNRVQRVEELLQSVEDDFNINMLINEYTLLSMAAGKGRLDIVNVLLQHGADPNGANGNFTPLGQASENGQLDVVKRLLKVGADPNRVGNIDLGSHPLVKAAEEGHADVVEVLLERGANVRHLDNVNHNSIYYAIRNENYNIAKRLIRAAFEQAADNEEAYTVENAIQDRVLSIPSIKKYFYENYAIYNQDNVPNQPLPTLPPYLKHHASSYVGGKSRKKRNRKRRKHKTTKKRKKNNKRKK